MKNRFLERIVHDANFARSQLSNARNVPTTLQKPKTYILRHVDLKHPKLRNAVRNGARAEGMVAYETGCNDGPHAGNVRSLHPRWHLAGPDSAQLRYNWQQSIKHHSLYARPGAVESESEDFTNLAEAHQCYTERRMHRQDL